MSSATSQDDTDLLFWGVLLTGRGSDLSDEGPGLLGTSLSPLGFVYVALDTLAPFLMPILYTQHQELPLPSSSSGFIPSKCDAPL
jgi:hypothetical protein